MLLTEITNADFFPMLLLEGKVDWIEKNQAPKLIKVATARNDNILQSKNIQSPRDMAEFIVSINEPFAPYVSKLYLTNQVPKLEDLYKVNKLIQTFQTNKRHLDNKDLMSYSLNQLTQTLQPYIGSETSSRVADPAIDQKTINSGQAIQLIKTNNFEVFIPLTKEASCYLGKETDWCTASGGDHNMWDQYKNNGNIYIIRAGKRRFQLQVEADQFMDEKDNELEEDQISYLSQFPPYKKFLDMLIQKHYFNKKVIKTYQPKD